MSARSAAPWVCGVLLFGGLIVDLNTAQELVVAILFAVPIAVSAVLLSKRVTIASVVIAQVFNIAAAFDNAHSMGRVDQTTVTNRALAALTFFIVGGLSVLLEDSTREVEDLHDVEQQITRERDIRTMLIGLSGQLGHDELVEQAVEGLRALLQADAVVVVALDDEVRFAEPRWALPPHSPVAPVGRIASWAVDALPIAATPVITVRDDAGIYSVGRWRCDEAVDLIVVARRPGRTKSSELLGEALAGLEPLRSRAVLVDRLRSGDADQPAAELS